MNLYFHSGLAEANKQRDTDFIRNGGTTPITASSVSSKEPSNGHGRLRPLQDSIKGWLWDREDLAGRVPDFITMAGKTSMTAARGSDGGFCDRDVDRAAPLR
jgi:hypothetical protein